MMPDIKEDIVSLLKTIPVMVRHGFFRHAWRQFTLAWSLWKP